jgi:hypothetical protein
MSQGTYLNSLSFRYFHLGLAIEFIVATPLLEQCEDDTHTPKMGTWESSETPKTSEFDYRGQNTSHWNVFYIIGKLSKFKCRKWPHMSHLDICNTSYGKKKGRESNWRFDSRPLKVKNRPDPGVCRWSATHRWKALKESYKFPSDLIPIGGLKKELWARKVPRVQIGTILRLLTPPWESQDKKPFECKCRGQTKRILYGGRWWFPPSPGRGESCESRIARGLS